MMNADSEPPALVTYLISPSAHPRPNAYNGSVCDKNSVFRDMMKNKNHICADIITGWQTLLSGAGLCEKHGICA